MLQIEKGIKLLAQQKFAEAYQCFHEGAPEDADCQCQEALLVLNGRGVMRNVAEGVRLLRESAERGAVDAYFHLSNLHYLGVGVAKDEQEGMRLLRLAVDRGSVPAMMRLGNMMMEGKVDGATPMEGLSVIEQAAATG